MTQQGVASYVMTVLGGIAAVTLTACAPPPITTIREPIGWAVGYYDPTTRTVHIDPTLEAKWDADYPGMGEWWEQHEYAHPVYLDLSQRHLLDFGAGFVGQERGAQCVTEVVLGHGPVWTDEAHGYWDCPDADVALTAAAMNG